VTLAHM